MSKRDFRFCRDELLALSLSRNAMAVPEKVMHVCAYSGNFQTTFLGKKKMIEAELKLGSYAQKNILRSRKLLKGSEQAKEERLELAV